MYISAGVTGFKAALSNHCGEEEQRFGESERSRNMKMWFLLLVIPAMDASPQLKYVESAIHFVPKDNNNSNNGNSNGNGTATIGNQEKAAALNSVYLSHAQLADHVKIVNDAEHVDHADDDHEDCCCSGNPGLRIVNRPPKTNDGHYHQHQPEHQHQHQQQKTCDPLVCCKRKSEQVHGALI